VWAYNSQAAYTPQEEWPKSAVSESTSANTPNSAVLCPDADSSRGGPLKVVVDLLEILAEEKKGGFHGSRSYCPT
jgi:hypothetical protein